MAETDQTARAIHERDADAQSAEIYSATIAISRP